MARQLTRAEQDAIIEATLVAYRITHYYMIGYWPAADENEESIRAALRLDDDTLAKIIIDHPEGLEWTSS